MKKTLFQGIITILLFLSTWFILSQVNWLSVLKIEQTKKNIEEKLGEKFWEFFKNTEDENDDPDVLNAVDSIITKICIENRISRSRINFHILNNDDANAFALPGGYLIIYSGLILASDSQEELAGAICHELAHIELDHVMKKLVKEVGLNVLVSMTTSGSAPEITRETAKLLSSTAYDRKLESAADFKAVDYLAGAKIDPEPFANLLYKMSDRENSILMHLSWINTHPESKERAEAILEYAGNKGAGYEKIILQETWDIMKRALSEE